MVCLGLEPVAAGRKAQTNPMSYGGTPLSYLFIRRFSRKARVLLYMKNEYTIKANYHHCRAIIPSST